MQPLRTALLTAVAFLSAWTACRSTPHDRRPAKPPLSASPAAPSHAVNTASSHPGPSHEQPAPVVVISAPPSLRALEELGFDLGSQLLGERAATTRELGRHAAYRALAETITTDLENDRRRDRSAGVGMRYAHRQFDARWLSSDKTRFELIAIVNRLDRRVFAPEYCGELRFIYRLAYSVDTPTGPVESRLPMNINLVRFQPQDPSGTCRQAASAWIPDLSASNDSDWLTSERGPLAAASKAPLKSVEVNLQSVRWPSTVRPNLGGHAEYILRVFHQQPKPPYWVPAKLENTIDVDRLLRDASLLNELTQWLALPATLTALDAGTLLVPERFLAERAVSVSPHGLARLTNRPYARVLSPRAFEGVDFRSYATLASPASVIRRLDDLSCQGCHQSRSLAGFHLLGEDPPDKQVDALRVPMSPHFHSEVTRRRDYVATVAAGGQPDETRPPAERGPGDDGVGSPCGLNDSIYGEWPCAAGLECQSLGDSQVGICLPGEGPSVGDACEYGPITHASAHRDAARLARTPCQGGRVCEANSVGFPGGMCAGSCNDLPPGAVCGGIALLVEFNTCLASGRAFERCVLENTRPGALRACSFHDPCRDDYVCARVPGGGACMPPYFLFQLRVDGHPI